MGYGIWTVESQLVISRGYGREFASITVALSLSSSPFQPTNILSFRHDPTSSSALHRGVYRIRRRARSRREEGIR